MKEILLLRHAKSSWDDSGLKDFDRPLNQRGREDAPRIGRLLRQIDCVPECVIASPAKRAEETVLRVAESAGLNTDRIVWNKNFYYGAVADYIKVLRTAPESLMSVMLVGHNPKMEEVAAILCGPDLNLRMPTAALVCLEHAANEWSQIQPGTARLEWMIIPELLKKMDQDNNTSHRGSVNRP